jgi:uncharacterized protein (TIGR00255 family)
VLASMTGFGSGRAQSPHGSISVEVRSVNHRFREVKCRLPRELAGLEPRIQARVAEHVDRGALDVAVRVQGMAGGRRRVSVDHAYAGQVVGALRELKARHHLAGAIDLDAVLGVEGVLLVDEQPLEAEALAETLDAALTEALQALVAMRREEGRALERDLTGRLEAMAASVEEIAGEADRLVEAYRERLEGRLERLLGDRTLDAGRLEAEVALLADRADVSEELTRLRSHIEQSHALVTDENPAVGRRLGFLLQEMNREVNTIGSKSQSLGISSRVVEMKAELERMREQVQNVE